MSNRKHSRTSDKSHDYNLLSSRFWLNTEGICERQISSRRIWISSGLSLDMDDLHAKVADIWCRSLLCTFHRSLSSFWGRLYQWCRHDTRCLCTRVCSDQHRLSLKVSSAPILSAQHYSGCSIRHFLQACLLNKCTWTCSNLGSYRISSW